MSRQYSLDRTALLKVLLHALKHPTTGVSGYLLGEEKTSDGQTTLHIYDAAPVAHSHLTLPLPLEAALVQLQAHAAATGGGLRVVGYYQAAERLDDADLGEVGRKIATRVESAFPGSIALVLDGKALEGLAKGSGTAPPVKLLHKDATRGWIHAPTTGAEATFTCPTAGVADLLAAYVAEGRHRRLRDFEDHLEAVEADWLNAGLLD